MTNQAEQQTPPTASARTSRLLVFLLFVPFFLPSGFDYGTSFGWFTTGSKVWQGAAVLILGVQALLFFLRERIPYALAAFAVMVAVLGFSTVSNGFSLVNIATGWAAYLVFAVGTYIYVRRDPAAYLVTLRAWLLCVAVANLVSMLLWPHGLPGTAINAHASGEIANYIWLWGFKNSLASLLLPLSAVTVVADRLRGRVFSAWQAASSVLLLATALLSSSSTLLTVTVLLLAMQLLFAPLRLSWLVNARTVFVMWLAVNLAVVVFRAQELFVGQIAQLFGKDATLSARTTIWELAFGYISRSPIYGLGVQGDQFVLKRFNSAFSHTHNALLMIMFCGGLLALVFFLLFAWGASSPLYRRRHEVQACTLSIILGAYYVISVTGSFLSISVVAILALALVYDRVADVAAHPPEKSIGARNRFAKIHHTSG